MATSQITSVIILPPKHPDTTRTYTVNLASADGTNDGSSSDTGFLQGDTISSVVWTVPSGITQDSESATTKALTFTMSGGTDEETYDLEADVTLAGGDVEVLIIRIPVRTQGT